MKRKMKKKLIAFMLCMVLVICNSVSILADTPAAATTTAENQVSETKTAKNEKSSEENKSTDDNDTSKQSEETDETKDEAPEATTTEKKEETTEATTEEKEDATTATTESEETTTEATTEDKATTEAADETSESDKKKETTTAENSSETSGTTEETTEAADETTTAAEDGETTAANVKTYEYKSDDVNVTVTLNDPADLPDEAELTVKPVELSEEVKEKIIKDAVGEENEEFANDINAYDITFMLDGKEVQPKAEVKVKISKLDIEEAAEAFVYHVDDNNKIEDMGGKVNKEGDVVFDTTHFSEYAVLAYNNTIVDLYNDPVTDYSTLLNNMKSNVEAESSTNIPIKNWKRTADEDGITLNKVSGSYYDWSWEDVTERLDNLSVTDESEVWDGSRLTEDRHGNKIVSHNFSNSAYLTQNMITVNGTGYGEKLYDSATWTDRGDGDDKATMHRFQGTFTLPEGYEENINDYAYTLTPVTGNNQIYINDDLFVFVYPEGTQIDDSNFTDYLAFWTGTVNTSQNNPVKFHGRPGTWARGWYEGIQPTGFARLTNGWYCSAVDNNVGNILENANGARTFVVDIFVDDYADGGGMYRLMLEREPVQKTEVTFKKINKNTGEGIQGVRFDFDTDGSHYYAVSDENGYVTVNMVDGTYTMTETTPNGYEEPGGTWTVTVESGSFKIRWNGYESDKVKYEYDAEAGKQIYKIPNTPTKRTTADFEFIKVKSDDSALPGATFELEKINDSNTPYKETATSAEKTGIVLFEGLSEGTYSLEETKAPDGYVVSSIKWIVEVAEDPETGDMKATLYRPGANGEEPVEVDRDEGSKKYKISNATEEEWIKNNLVSHKDAKVKDWNKRTYDITISASSEAEGGSIETGGGKADIAFVLDKSGSMNYGENKGINASYVGVGWFGWQENDLDKTKVYYITDSHYPMIYIEGKWQYYRYGYGGSWWEPDDYFYVYTCDSRMTGLKESAIAFVKSLAESSPDSNIAVYTFSHNAQETISDLKNVKANEISIIKGIAAIRANGGTSPAQGLNLAYNALKNIKSENKNVILFTDGEPTGDGSSWDPVAQSNAETSASNIKENGITLYTVGLYLTKKTETWLAGGSYYGTNYVGIASPGCAKNADGIDSLKEIFKDIQQSIIGSLSIEATVTDVIDPRFEIVDETGTPIEADENGTPYKEGIVYKDQDGNYKIEWTEQTIKPSDEGGWSKTFTVKAKDTYIGGNNVTTNVWPDSKISTGYGDAILPQPVVNVKADLLVGNETMTIFKGETVPTDEEILNKLFNEEQPEGMVNGGTQEYELGNDKDNDYVLDPSEFTLEWYKDEACTEKITVDKMGQATPENTTQYYLKVSFNPGEPTKDSNENTTQDGKIHYAGKEEDSYIITATNTDDKNKPYGIYTINVVTGTINIEKKSGSTTGTGLDGAVFKIEKWNLTGGADGKGAWKTITGVGDDGTDQVKTKDGGKASFTNLGKGKYRITEIQAPEGHSLLANPIIVEEFPYPSSDASSGVSVSEDNIYKTETINDEEVKYYHTITYTIVNNELFEMPEAGGRNIFMMTLAGTAMIALAAGSTIYYRRRRGAHNKTR